MTIGQRIAQARRGKRWSQARLAAEVGKGQTTISSWETDRTEPTREDVARIANRLAISVVELEDLGESGPPVVDVPLISWVSAGSVSDIGNLGEADVDNILPMAGLPSGDYFATDVRGDSMDRISPESSRIFVNVSDRELISGRYYIFSLRGETTFKVYQKEPVPRLEPSSTNPMNKIIFLVDRDWYVVGRVVRTTLDL